MKLHGGRLAITSMFGIPQTQTHPAASVRFSLMQSFDKPIKNGSQMPVGACSS